MKINVGQIAKIAIGLYLLAPGPEDVATAGLSVGPSALLGAAMVADGFGVRWMPV